MLDQGQRPEPEVTMWSLPQQMPTTVLKPPTTAKGLEMCRKFMKRVNLEQEIVLEVV